MKIVPLFWEKLSVSCFAAMIAEKIEVPKVQKIESGGIMES